MKVKKISALLMAAAVLAGSVPAQAVFAEEASQENIFSCLSEME